MNISRHKLIKDCSIFLTGASLVVDDLAVVGLPDVGLAVVPVDLVAGDEAVVCVVVFIVVGSTGSVGHGPGVQVILTVTVSLSCGTVPEYLIVITIPESLSVRVNYNNQIHHCNSSLTDYMDEI